MPLSHVEKRTSPILDRLMPVTTSAGGVTLHIDRESECYYMDVAFEHEPLARYALASVARDSGLEFMEENDYPPIIEEDGSIRLWLEDAALDADVSEFDMPLQVVA